MMANKAMTELLRRVEVNFHVRTRSCGPYTVKFNLLDGLILEVR